MQVFTTIFLAETLRANRRCVEEADGLEQDFYGLHEFKHSLRERIAFLESRDWFVDDGFDEN